MSLISVNQLLMFILETFLTALLVLGLFRLRDRLGLSALYITLGVFQPIQVILASSIYVEILPGVVISPGSVVMFTASLFAVLLVYIREDAMETRKVIYGIMIANLSMTLLLYIFGIQLGLKDTLNFLNLPAAMFNQNARVMLVGTLVLFIDVILIILVYELVWRFIKKNLFLRIYITMAIILTFDSLAFATGAFWGQPNYGSVLYSGMIGKLGLALFFTLALGLYLRFAEPVKAKEQPANPFQDIFYALTYRQKYQLEHQISTQSEEKLQRWDQIFQTAGWGIVLVDPKDNHILAANPAFAHMHGYALEEMIGMDLKDTFAPESRSDLPEHARKVLEQGHYIYESIHIRKDGSTFPALADVNIIKDQDGRVLFRSANVQDITEPKKAESALRESQQYNRMLFESSPIGLALCRMDGSLVDCNAAYTKIIGRSTEETIQLSYWDITPEQYADQEQIQLKSLETTGRYGPYEKEYIHKEGHRVPVLLSGLIVEKGGQKFIWSSAEDITERKQAQAKLETSQARFRTFYENSMDAILLTSPDGSIQAANPAAVELFGWTETEITQLGRTGLVDATDPRLNELLAERAAKGKARGEITMLRKDGTKFPVELASAIFQDSEGQVRSNMIIRDITGRKQAEIKLSLSEKRFSNAFHVSPAGITITRIADGIFIDANETFLEMFGFTRSEVIGHTSTELKMWSPEERKRLIERQIEAGGLRNFELEARSKSGKSIKLLFSSAVLDQEGESCLITTMIDITDHKQAELKLQKNEQMLRLFIEHSPAAIAMFDTQMKYLAASRRYHQDYRLTQQDLVGFSHYEIFPEIPERWKEIHKRCLFGEIEKCDQDPFPRGDGTVDWIRWETHPWYQASGDIGGIILFSEIITEQVLAEKQIRRHNQELSALNDLGRQVSRMLSPDEMISNTLQSLVEAVQPDAAFFFQRQAQELILKDIHPHQARLRLQDMPEHRVGECMCGLAVTQNRPLYSMDIYKDLRCTWQECKKAGMRSFAALPLRSGSEVIGVIGLASDTERDFESQAAFLETLADQVAIGFHNARLYEQIQHQFNDLNIVHQAGQSLHSLLKPELLSQEIIRVLENMVGYENGSVLLVDEETQRLVPFALSDQGQGAGFIKKDKEYVASRAPKLGEGITGWVAQHGQSLRLDDVTQDVRYIAIRPNIRSELCVPLKMDNRTMGVVNVETTMPNAYTESDQRLLETIASQISVSIQNARLLTQVQSQASELEQRVAERTADLEAKSQALDTFTYTVSHDLKAPLRGIDGYSRLLLEDHLADLDDDGRQFLFNIRQAAGQMNDLIEDLLQYSRIERHDLILGRVNLNQLTGAILAEHAAEIKARGVKVTVKIPFEEITADAEGLTLAIRNLLDNALKFTQKVPRPAIKITGREGEKGYMIKVSDNGIGIDEQFHESIFDIFQRLHRVEDYPGSGVGLAIVRKTMERMAGRVWVESTPGQGATFFLEVPK